jgi:hypothetical protein
MAIQISPGVNVSEVDLTTVVPSVLTTAGAFVGNFKWGPANVVKTIDSEITLVNTFGKPDTDSAVSFFTAANFLAYGNNLNVVRVVGNLSNNSTCSASTIQVENEDEFQVTYLGQNNSNTYGPFIARYVGDYGNNLQVSVCANSATFSAWSYSSYFTSAPGTSTYVSSAGGSNDEMHIVVIDKTGAITGTANTVIEKFGFVSAAIDASVNGESNYYKQVVFDKSKYIYAIDPIDYGATSGTWGTTAVNKTFVNPSGNETWTLDGGSNIVPSSANINSGWTLFGNKETTDISLAITGAAGISTQQYVIDNIAASRQDCIAFISPPSANVVSQAGSETTNITNWLTALSRSSSYAVADSGWKYQFDKYNNVYRYIPLNGDIAGLCVRTDSQRDPWFSPAGYTRGGIKNCIKLSWNPNKANRDTLYAKGVNPVVSFPGQGTILYGDKTLLSKPSAFDRINVRRLFIVLEKAIAQAAQFSLFELNDEFTRAQFVSFVTPFLRDIQGRRGIYDFKVVCDTTNNTQQIIDSNQFVGDIYIKPARSINYIQLNFVAVATGVDFTTIVGAV